MSFSARIFKDKVEKDQKLTVISNLRVSRESEEATKLPIKEKEKKKIRFN